MKAEQAIVVVLVLFAFSAAKKKVMPRAAVLELAKRTGFPDPELATAVALAESGGNVLAIGDFGRSYGLWQIHTPAHPEHSPGNLLTADYNARAAFAISKNGTNWLPWTTFRNGDYKRFLSKPREGS